MLSYPSSLQGHSDFPTPLTPILPVSPDLVSVYHRRSPAQTLGPQALPPLSFTACRWPYPGSPAGARALSLPASTGLLPVIRGSACIPALRGLSLTWTLPAIPAQVQFTRLHHLPYATACGFGRPPWLGMTRPYYGTSLLGTVSGQVQPVRYHTNPPSAYTFKWGTDVVTSFHVAR